ncbi:MAG TPA: hypothetical protein VL403_04735 [Candidatus Kryptonia bacterium]|nr:hypothetical protein [Candidatus Kryptonia bacterium]
MNRPRVYAVSESERIGETLAILLDPTCDYRWLRDEGNGPLPSLPPPALLIDARAQPHRRVRASAALRHWPGVRTLTLDLLGRPDPVAAQTAVLTALRDTRTAPPIGDVIHHIAAGLHADLKPRLVAARALLAVATRQPDLIRHAAWRALCREQLFAIDRRIAAMRLATVAR